MSRKKISTTIYVTPEQNERLRLLHERTKVPVAVYIREGIDMVLQRYGNVLPGQLAFDQRDTPLSGDAVPSARSASSSSGTGASSGAAGRTPDGPAPKA